ncbi:MAG: DUF484 family protein [Alphaproteobacteria bacterium]|nr:DUF484 family protein [Alphaproteobacteria bacterium]
MTETAGRSSASPKGADGKTLPSDDEVRRFLEVNPDFLRENTDLAAIVAAPARPRGDGVVDMQQFLVERLRDENGRLKAVQQEMVENMRSNLHNQARAHKAVLALMGAPSFAHLIHAITNDFAIILDVDAVTLSVENAELKLAGQEGSGVQILAQGSIDALIGPGRRFRMHGDIVGERAVFGPAAEMVRSQALVRLTFSPETPKGLLAFGSRRVDAFDDSMGTDLLDFMGQSIEALTRQWLDLPPTA